MHRWWDEDAEERFWIEVTDRSDIGADLNAPDTNEKGRRQWSYDLVHEAAEGDTVFHFDQNESRFVGYSTILGDAWPDEVVWGARGTSARGQHIEPYPRPGHRRGLRGFMPTDGPTLDSVRSVEGQVLALRERLRATHRDPLYFPFVPYKGQPLGTFQGYFMKMPSDLVDLLAMRPPETASGAERVDDRAPPVSQERLGADYRTADEHVAVSTAEPFERDPALVERALKSHRATQNALADWAKWRGFEPLSPGTADPDWDVGWQGADSFVVIEVKSINEKNEERQLRLAVGQVLRYKQRISERSGSVEPVIATSRKPRDTSWDELCRSLGITLVWPDSFDRLARF
jgi:hypothetical protein